MKKNTCEAKMRSYSPPYFFLISPPFFLKFYEVFSCFFSRKMRYFCAQYEWKTSGKNVVKKWCCELVYFLFLFSCGKIVQNCD